MAVDRRPDHPAARAELPDPPPARSGWDAVDKRGRPPPDALHIDAKRAAHILGGDATGGGHRHGTGCARQDRVPSRLGRRRPDLNLSIVNVRIFVNKALG